MLSECSYYGAFNSRPLFEALALLDGLWEGHDFYRGFLSTRPGFRNPPGLFVSVRSVTPVAWYDVYDDNTCEARWNYLEARVGRQSVFAKSVRWNSSRGPGHLAEQSALDGRMAALPTILAGDFSTTSSAEGEMVQEDWGENCADAGVPWRRRQKGRRDERAGRWILNTEPVDELLADGFRDAGQEAGDFTPTLRPAAGRGIRVDRVLWSERLPAALVPGSYHVFDADGGGLEHAYVWCELELPEA
jgi:hypothetical protein